MALARRSIFMTGSRSINPTTRVGSASNRKREVTIG
jgi:hypothetical protein